MQAEMKNKSPDVKFMLEALVGCLMALTAVGDLLLEDPNFESLKDRAWAVASTLDSFLSENHQAKSFVFSDSM